LEEEKKERKEGRNGWKRGRRRGEETRKQGFYKSGPSIIDGPC
jgi:hypothetical protein